MSFKEYKYFRLEGNLGAKPDLKMTAKEHAMAVLSLATTASRKNDDGEWENTTDWHRIVCFGDVVNQVTSLEKGAHVVVEGMVKPRSYEDHEGKICNVIDMLAKSVIEQIKE